IRPMLAIPAVRAALARRRGPTVAVSPLVAGRAPSGPLAHQLRRLGLPASSVGIATCYRPFLDALVIDRRDRDDATALAEVGCRAIVADTRFRSAAHAARAARRIVADLGFR